MANEALYHDTSYRVPEHVLNQVRQVLSRAPAGTSGGERARGMLQDPSLSYSAAKRIKSDLEQPGAPGTAAYELAGGQAMLAWLNQALNQARQTEFRRKSTRHNAGQENSFRTSHEKNGATTLVAPHQKTSSGVRRQELFEAMEHDQSPTDQLAAALTAAFPDLYYEKHPASSMLVVIAGGLSIVITASGEGLLDEGWVGSTVRRIALAGAVAGAATQMPHHSGKTPAEVTHNQDVQHFEQAAKYAKRRETEGAVNRMTVKADATKNPTLA